MELIMGDLLIRIIVFLFIWMTIGIPVTLIVIGLIQLKNNKISGKILLITGIVYLLVSIYVVIGMKYGR